MLVIKCARCKRPLKGLQSLELGVGPRCRILQKQDSVKGLTHDLFGDPNYSHMIINHVLIITDLKNTATTVTAKIEIILRELNAVVKTLDTKIIIYKDNLGIFDGINVSPDGEFESYYAINTSNKNKAIKSARNKYERRQKF